MTRRHLTILLILLLIVLGACEKKDDKKDEKTPTAPSADVTTDDTEPTPTGTDTKRTLTIGTTDRIAKLDPADAYSFHDWELLRNVSDSLLGYAPGTVEVEPRLAVDLPTVSEDGLTYTFVLREGVKYPDGTELTAQMVVDWINRSLRIEGDPDGLLADVESVTLGENDNEIVFTLTQRFDLFPITLAAQPQTMPFMAGNYPDNEINNNPQIIQGVGAYQLMSYTLGEQAILEVNPNYYGEKPAFDRIIIVYYQEEAQLTLAIENGDVDVAWRSVLPTEADRLDQIANLDILTLPGNINYLLFNHESEIGSNANIRRAIAKLVDRDEIVDRAHSGLVDPIYSMVPPGFYGATESFLELYGFSNLQGAVDDLKAAGYAQDNKLKFDLWYPPQRYGAEMADAMTIVKQQLEASELIEVNLQAVEWSTYIAAATQGEYEVYILGWFFDFPDADNYLHPFASCEGSRGLGASYCNEQMEQLLSTERGLVGEPERETALAALQDFYAQEVVSVPLWVRQLYLVYDNTAVSSVVVGAPLVFEYRLLQPVE